MEIYDCAIIGGGLGGLTLSIQLAKKGYKVILFEKNKYPFHKVCGEYISLESYDFLLSLGLELNEMNLPIINEVKITAPNGKFIFRPLDLGGFGISRYLIDSKLAELAKKLNVKVLEQTKVEDIQYENDNFIIKTETEEFHSLMACGAFGKNSNIDLKLSRNYLTANPYNNFVGVKYHIKTDFPSNRIELHNFQGGYCGISKIENDTYCLCYLTHSQNLRDHNNSIEKMQENILFKNSYLKKYFLESEFIFKKPLTISQINLGKKSIIENHLLLLGDAAGTVAPLSGNGMSIAMRASYELAKLLDEFFNKKITRAELELAYKNKWENLFNHRVNTTLYLQKIFGKNFVTNLIIGSLSKSNILTDKIISLTHGKKF